MCQLKSWHAFLADVVSAALAWRRKCIYPLLLCQRTEGWQATWKQMVGDLGRARQTCIGAAAIGGVDRLKVEGGPAGLCKSRLVPMSSSRRSALFPTSIAQTFHLFPHNLILNTALFPGCLVPPPFPRRVSSSCGCLFDFSHRLAASACLRLCALRRCVW